MESGIWSLYLPVPVFWGVLAAWIPVPPSVMAGILVGAMAYALGNYLLGLREWIVEDRELTAFESHEPLEAAARL